MAYPEAPNFNLDQVYEETLDRASSYGVDIAKVKAAGLKTKDFRGAPLDSRQALAIAVEAQITAIIGERYDQRTKNRVITVPEVTTLGDVYED